MSCPAFLLALASVFILFVATGESLTGLNSAEFVQQSMSWGKFLDMLPRLALVVFIIALSQTAGMIRSMRAMLLDELQKQYVITARAKGISPVRVVMKHEFKNSLVPLVSNLGVGIASVLMGSFVVESMFLIPGLGRYFVDSITNLDYSLIMGLTVFYGAFLVTMNLLVDVLYGFLDPRIRETVKGAAK